MLQGKKPQKGGRMDVKRTAEILQVSIWLEVEGSDTTLLPCPDIPYYRLNPYTGRIICRTVLVSGLIHRSTAVLQYGPKPYAYHEVYGRNRIQYGQHP
jgi:hypothetical protein